MSLLKLNPDGRTLKVIFDANDSETRDVFRQLIRYVQDAGCTATPEIPVKKTKCTDPEGEYEVEVDISIGTTFDVATIHETVKIVTPKDMNIYEGYFCSEEEFEDVIQAIVAAKPQNEDLASAPIYSKPPKKPLPRPLSMTGRVTDVPGENPNPALPVFKLDPRPNSDKISGSWGHQYQVVETPHDEEDLDGSYLNVEPVPGQFNPSQSDEEAQDRATTFLYFISYGLDAELRTAGVNLRYHQQTTDAEKRLFRRHMVQTLFSEVNQLASPEQRIEHLRHWRNEEVFASHRGFFTRILLFLCCCLHIRTQAQVQIDGRIAELQRENDQHHAPSMGG